MVIEELKSNLLQEKKILDDMILLTQESASLSSLEERNFFNEALASLNKQLAILNNSVPELIEAVSMISSQAAVHTIKLETRGGFVSLNKDEKKRFMAELKLEHEAFKKIRKRRSRVKKSTGVEFFKKANPYVSLSSAFFSKLSFNLSDKGFKKLNSDLRKANMAFIVSSYISTAIFTSLLVFILALFIAVFFSFYGFSLVADALYPVLSPLTSDGMLLRLLQNMGIAFLTPLMTLMFFYLYPGSQAKSISQGINNELPFVIIHMASIAGSGVEPSRIFGILAMTEEYPVTSKEMRKLVNQINLYGYDLVNALRTTGKATSSDKLRDLLNGMATNITQGGDIKSYLEKKGEDALLDYKLERRKYASIAETSMDMYIGILIAAPLILMVLLILMNLTGIGAIDNTTLTWLIIGGISLLNIAFLAFLKFKEPAG